MVCGAACFVLLQVAFETAQPLLLMYPEVVDLSRLRLAQHPIMVGCAVCGVACAVWGGRVNPVRGLFVA